MIQSELPKPAPSHSASSSTHIADHWLGLERIFEGGINCCVLPRMLSPALVDTSRSLAHARVDLEMEIDTRDPAAIHQLQLPPLPVTDTALQSDLVSLVDLLETITGATRVGLRLASLHRAMCPRFHVDRIGLRLVCTYEGPGTEWLLEEHTDRDALRSPWDPVNHPDAGLAAGSTEIRRMPTGAIGLLKGERWPGNVGHGVVHRSPAVATDSPRLLLSLDPC